MLKSWRLLPAIGRTAVRVPDRVAHALVLREIETWVRVEFLGVMARTRIAEVLRDGPLTTTEIMDATDVVDAELLVALLDLGVSLREVRHRKGRFAIRGRRLRAIAGSSPDLRGLVEEIVAYDNAVYAAMRDHLAGAPPAPYDADCDEAIAAASRIAEPILAPAVREAAAQVGAKRVLDIGCGSGVYLGHLLDVRETASGVGVEMDLDAAAAASELLDTYIEAGRCEVRHGDFDQVAPDLGHFDLVTLLNNIYYWPSTERVDLLQTIGDNLAPGGTLVLATAIPEGPFMARHLDLLLRVTTGCYRLPTRAELEADLQAAGYSDISVIEPIPKSGFVIATASLDT